MTGLQKRVLVCKRCLKVYTHTNQMERRHEADGQPQPKITGGWDWLERRWFNTHTLACANATPEVKR